MFWGEEEALGKSMGFKGRGLCLFEKEEGKRTSGTHPGGKLCLYMHLSPPFGHAQSHPYFPFSTASMKYLHTLSVVVLGLPCLLRTTCRSFSVVHHHVSEVLDLVSKNASTNLHPNPPCHPSSSLHQHRLLWYLDIDSSSLPSFLPPGHD